LENLTMPTPAMRAVLIVIIPTLIRGGFLANII